ncbi:peptidase U32 [Candidatus Marinamargulisbacteria bacterium SCGC AAA071-K20]|nr:peptidase U32 [Candidatus Marinamargulisbacteria bacterium SCGC AAA071-K20]
MNTLSKPELLAPAGNLEKLKIALLYGADAVYVGGHVFGLRKYADNFSETQLEQGIAFANSLNKRVYLVLNGFAHNQDLDQLLPYFKILNKLKPHGLIISDMGIVQLAKAHTNIPIHISTQASVTNKYTTKLYKDAGAKRVILAREVSIEDCKEIKAYTDIELEVFVHGAMCASYSGKCIISNYSAGRDSNRGGCVQSCRHKYHLFDPETKEEVDQKHIMNAKDLMAVNLLPDLIISGVDSLKVEGRMKSNMYVANISKVYRQAIDYCFDCIVNKKEINPEKINTWQLELSKVSNRSFSTGGLEDRPFSESIRYNFDKYEKDVDYIGTVKDCLNDALIIENKVPFEVGDQLELVSPSHDTQTFQVTNFFDLRGNRLEKSKPNSIVSLPFEGHKEKYSLLRKCLSA